MRHHRDAIEPTQTTAALTRRALLMALAASGIGAAARASGAPEIETLTLVIPGSEGGGWDSFARAIGTALTGAGLVGSVTYRNLPGGGGATAIDALSDISGEARGTTLMIASTPFTVRAAQGRFGDAFGALTPVAALTGDPAAVLVPTESAIASITDLLAAYDADPLAFALGGGTAPGGLDHLAASLAMEASGRDPLALRYQPFGARGDAVAALVSGGIAALAGGLSTALPLAGTGEFRILGIAAEARSPADPDVPTLREAGIEAEFLDWTGVLAAPDLPQADFERLTSLFARLAETPDWQAARIRNRWIASDLRGEAFGALLARQQEDFSRVLGKLGFL